MSTVHRNNAQTPVSWWLIDLRSIHIIYVHRYLHIYLFPLNYMILSMCSLYFFDPSVIWYNFIDGACMCIYIYMIIYALQTIDVDVRIYIYIHIHTLIYILDTSRAHYATYYIALIFSCLELRILFKSTNWRSTVTHWQMILTFLQLDVRRLSMFQF